MIVGNKSDLNNKRCTSREDAEELAKELGADYFETSAKDGNQIEELFTFVTKKAVEMDLVTKDANLMPTIDYAPSSSNSCGC